MWIYLYTSRKIWNRANSEHIKDYRMRLDECLLCFTLYLLIVYNVLI